MEQEGEAVVGEEIGIVIHEIPLLHDLPDPVALDPAPLALLSEEHELAVHLGAAGVRVVGASHGGKTE